MSEVPLRSRRPRERERESESERERERKRDRERERQARAALYGLLYYAQHSPNSPPAGNVRGDRRAAMPCERRGNNVKGFQDFCLEVGNIFWS